MHYRLLYAPIFLLLMRKENDVGSFGDFSGFTGFSSIFILATAPIGRLLAAWPRQYLR